ncbi:MAG: NAD-dependent epimerase/dehydratase family protein [Acidimicrobiales bacterium]
MTTPGFRLLVVGGNGYLGRALRALAPVEVITTTRAGSPGTVRLDPTDATAVAALVDEVGPSAVVNAAGTSTGDPDTLHRANVAVVDGLLDGVGDVPMVLIGSAAEYGPPPGTDPITERTPARPVTDYGRTKARATELAHHAHAAGRAVVVARLFNLAGPGLPPTSPLGSFCAAVLAAQDGDTVEVRSGSTVRDVVTVGFAVDALVALARMGRTPEPVVNLASGVGLRFDDVIRALAIVAGRTITVHDRAEASPIPTLIGDATRLQRWCGLAERATAAGVASACLDQPWTR